MYAKYQQQYHYHCMAYTAQGGAGDMSAACANEWSSWLHFAAVTDANMRTWADETNDNLHKYG
jgi:hypothetical protein